MSTEALFLVPGRAGPSVRFRVLQYLPGLERRGIRATVADLDVRLRARLAVLRTASRYPRVIVHRAFLTPPERVLLRRAPHGYVYDFDDALWCRDSSRRPLASWQRRWRLRGMLSGATSVIAGNAYLAAWASRHHHRVAVVPTAVDLGAYPDEPAADTEPVVGWMGTKSNLMYLRPVLPALVRVAREHALKLRVVSDGVLDSPFAIEVEQQPWSLADEVADLRSFRIGIMPLPDDEWTRGKCGLKVLQYLAAGVPVVCSPVGANREIVEDGVNGLFAASEDEWVEQVGALLQDAPRRRRLAEVGRRTVAEGYSVEASLEKLLAAIG